MGAGAENMPRGANAAGKRGGMDEDEESVRRIREEHTKIPSLISKYEEVFGNENERIASDRDVLKKIPPDTKQAMTSKNMEYIKQETTRLSEGYKKLRDQRTTLLRELEDIQRRYESIFERGAHIASRLRVEKSEGVRKMEELEARCLNDRLQVAKAKAALNKEAEAVARVEAAAEEARRALKICEEQLATAEIREREAQKRAETAEAVANAQNKNLKTARDEVVQLQKVRLLTDAKHAENLEVEKATWNRKVRELEQELEQANTRLSDVCAQEEKIRQQMSMIRTDNQKKDALLESLRERALDAEQKLNQKDGNVNLALQTLQKAQELNESRMEALTKEKVRLEQKIEELNTEKSEATARLFETTAIVERVRDRTEQMAARVAELERKHSEAEAKLHSTQAALETARNESASKAAKCAEAKDALERAMETLNAEKTRLADATQDLQETVALEQHVQEELGVAQAAFERIKSSPTKMNRLLEETRAQEELKRRAGDVNYYKARVEQLQAELANAKKTLFESDAQRRTLLNEVQNLKGNIRVVARVRPPNAATKSIPDPDRSQLVCSMDCMNLTLELRGNQQRRGQTSASGTSETHAFSFNRVFDKDSTQHAVFDEVSSFVQSALDGYDVCLFSYGQTGSGKTWTMTGDLTNPMNRGIIPRSVDHILLSIAQMRDKGWAFDIECSFLEIYNETIRDLLAADPRAEKTAKHDIQHRNGKVFVTGIRRVPVKEADEVQSLLEQADKFRSVAMTDKNAESSRSHSIFTIHLVGRNIEKPGAELVGSLSLCDLAGSERLKSSKAAGERLKETQAINTSLSALATVFSSIAQKSPHIPFRNSTLTHLLMPCLSGDGKTLMIVNLSSDHDDAQESLCSLRFAQQVNKTELGQAKKNVRGVTAAPSAASGASSSSVGGALMNRARNASQ